MRDTRTFVIKIKDHWTQIPDWILALAEACDASTQSQIAIRLGVSNALISTVLRNQYPGDVERIETMVRGVLLAETVICPVVGEISKNRCLENQSKTHFGTDSFGSRLRKACRNGTCPHSRIGVK